MKTKYLERLNSLAVNKTFYRKVEYLKYNFGTYIDLLNSNSSILEIGPGLGELEFYLNSKKIFNIDIVDNDKEVLNNINRNFRINKAILASDLSKKDTILKKYDLIVMVQVLEHIPILIQKNFLNILYKHLKKGGCFFIVVPNANNPLGIVERYADYQHTIAFTEQSLKDLVVLANLKNAVLKISGFEIPPINVVNVTRIVLQKFFHTILLVILIINGGVFFKILTPNLLLVICKK